MNTIYLGGWQKADPHKINLLKADVNYTQVYFTNGRKITVATTLGILENRLSEQHEFFRINRGLIINRDFVEKTESPKNFQFIILKNGQKITVSRRRQKAFKSWISLPLANQS